MGKKRCFFQNELMCLKLQFLELVLVLISELGDAARY